MKIRLIINDQMLSATMEDSIPAREFIAQLPLTLQLEDYAATEKIAITPKRGFAPRKKSASASKHPMRIIGDMMYTPSSIRPSRRSRRLTCLLLKSCRQ